VNDGNVVKDVIVRNAEQEEKDTNVKTVNDNETES
jgi:hypothetical protein